MQNGCPATYRSTGVVCKVVTMAARVELAPPWGTSDIGDTPSTLSSGDDNHTSRLPTVARQARSHTHFSGTQHGLLSSSYLVCRRVYGVLFTGSCTSAYSVHSRRRLVHPIHNEVAPTPVVLLLAPPPWPSSPSTTDTRAASGTISPSLPRNMVCWDSGSLMTTDAACDGRAVSRSPLSSSFRVFCLVMNGKCTGVGSRRD